MSLTFRYDKEADAAYIELHPIPAGGVARTEVADVELDSAAINLDFDKNGRLVGIEILGARRILPSELLESPTEQ